MTGKPDRSKRPKKDKDDKWQKKGKRKFCVFCKDKIDYVDYKDVLMLRKFTSERGKIRARRVTGNCVQHQAQAVKNAREMALLPYSSRSRSSCRRPSTSSGTPGRPPRLPTATRATT